MTPVTNPTRPQRLALGIDVSQETLALALLLPDDTLHTKSVRNDPSGFNRLPAPLVDDSVEEV